MTPLDAALAYAARRGWPVFPCAWSGPRRKQPLIARGFHEASTEEAVIRGWWSRWPAALVGVPTGRRSGFVVLDIDIKRDDANGFDSLAEMGAVPLPDTPMAHTASGGLHVYFGVPERELRNSAGRLGPGLDVRGEGGYVVVPSPGSGYRWDPSRNLRTVPLAPAPAWIWPAEPDRCTPARPVRPSAFMSRYAEAALDRACRAIIAAAAGSQERTVNSEAFAIGTLAGAGGIPAGPAREALRWAALKMPSCDPRRPWRAKDLEDKVDRAFAAGLDHPREARRHG